MSIGKTTKRNYSSCDVKSARAQGCKSSVVRTRVLEVVAFALRVLSENFVGNICPARPSPERDDKTKRTYMRQKKNKKQCALSGFSSRLPNRWWTSGVSG